MNVFDRWVKAGGSIRVDCDGEVVGTKGDLRYSAYSWAEVQGKLEIYFDVPNPQRLQKAGWTRVCGETWQKNGVQVDLTSTELTLWGLEQRADAITPVALGVTQGKWANTFTWVNPHGCTFHLRHDHANVWSIYPSETSASAIYPATDKLSIIKSDLEKLK